MFIKIVSGPGTPRVFRRDELLPILGPSVVIMCEQLVKWFPQDNTASMDDIELAVRMGLSLSQLHKVIKRAVEHGQARVDQSTGTEVLVVNANTSNDLATARKRIEQRSREERAKCATTPSS